MNYNVKIFGYGIVGQTLYSMIDRSKVSSLEVIDPKFNYEKMQDCEESNYIAFICVNADNNNGIQDLKNIKNVLDNIQKLNLKNLICVIKSTILPSNIDFLIKKYKNLSIVTNPEFLLEDDSFNSMKKEKLCIIGSNDIQSSLKLKEFYELNTYFNFSDFEFCSPREAMEIKYARNCLGALKVLYFHSLHEIGFNSSKIERIFNKFEEVNPQGLLASIGKDGYKGFGGKCFIKDFTALKNSVNCDVTKELYDKILHYNACLILDKMIKK